MFERFTERARQVIVLAQDEARLLKHNYIGTEHLLLGLLRQDEGLAARVLGYLDVTLEEVRAQVARIVGQGDEILTVDLPFTPRAKKVLELSMREALSLGHTYIGTEHILLGIVRENEGVAARILLDFEADAPRIQQEILRRLAGEEPSEPRPRLGLESMHSPAGMSYARSLPGRRLRLSHTSYGERLPWWERSQMLIGLVLGASLFGAGLLVGWLIWG